MTQSRRLIESYLRVPFFKPKSESSNMSICLQILEINQASGNIVLGEQGPTRTFMIRSSVAVRRNRAQVIDEFVVALVDESKLHHAAALPCRRILELRTTHVPWKSNKNRCTTPNGSCSGFFRIKILFDHQLEHALMA